MAVTIAYLPLRIFHCCGNHFLTSRLFCKRDRLCHHLYAYNFKYIRAVIVCLLWLGCPLYPVGGGGVGRDPLLTPMLVFRLWV